jgi:trk system potassium uptake protein TrkH
MVLRAGGPAPIRILVGSFFALIAAGACLLKLPVAAPAGQPIGWIDAAFTATSAVCVTGLAVRDTGTGFTGFGQTVILLLIQLGGLGIMTFWLLVFWLLRGRVSLAFRSVFERTLAGAVGDRFWPVLKLVFLFTLACEGAGALALFLRFLPEMGAGRALWHAVFHAVSAFCNAGFGLRPDNLMAYAGDLTVNLTVMALIVLGGLGFITVHDLTSLRRGRRLSLHSKLVLSVSAVLVVLGAVAFWLLEAGHALAGMSPRQQVLASLFQSVTPRTAGFNTVDIGALLPGTLFLLCLLMFVGGSPGSCAGGIKTTSLGVLVLAAWSRFRGGTHSNAFHRSLDAETVANALAVAAGGLVVQIAGLFAVLVAQQAVGPGAGGGPGLFLASFFETISALGTVGLSTGLTPHLTPAARVVIILLMFVGRLGPLTVAAALAVPRPSRDWEYPEEGVMVG